MLFFVKGKGPQSYTSVIGTPDHFAACGYTCLILDENFSLFYGLQDQNGSEGFCSTIRDSSYLNREPLMKSGLSFNCDIIT